MVLRDLINNEQGEAYVVNCKNGTVRKIDCAIASSSTLAEWYNVSHLFYRLHQYYNLVVFSKTKQKNSHGYRIPITFSWQAVYARLDNIDLDKTSCLWYGQFNSIIPPNTPPLYLITVSRDEAYNHAKIILHGKIKKVNMFLLKQKKNFDKISSENECQSFRDLIDNENGEIYAVHSEKLSIRKIKCVITSGENLLNQKYGYWWYNIDRNAKHVLIGLSKVRNQWRDMFYWRRRYIAFTRKMLDSKQISSDDYYIFCTKKDAYNYIVAKKFENKKKIHDKILKLVEKQNKVDNE